MRTRRYFDVRKRFVWLAGTAFVIGLAVLAYRGPGRAIVRGHVGDVAAAMFVYAVIGFALPRTRRMPRAIAAFGFATAIEIGQAFWHARSTLGALTIGDTCDAWDIVAYFVGVGVALFWERAIVARSAACASP